MAQTTIARRGKIARKGLAALISGSAKAPEVIGLFVSAMSESLCYSVWFRNDVTKNMDKSGISKLDPSFCPY